ncbi:MAG: hypothetical protein EBX37_00310 [Alphaproteobacteria bacterium]|nr:hypothetical protein [Alphaproteobacteria bacterium]
MGRKVKLDINETATLLDHTERIIAKAWADDGFKARLLAEIAAMATAQVLLILTGLKMVGFAATDPMVRS